ncbi:PEP-CTERM sorting domain-containing protein [Novipirellula galeiformis]|nr:PEP-CTERM sorting domain-containing protein [Novipirellula galeiformis]
MSVRRCLVSLNLVAASALIACGITNTPVSGAVITGDPTTTTGAGLQLIGNSMDPQFKADTIGGGFAYDVYTGRYTVSASDVIGGANVIGNTGQGVQGGAFNIGDDIFVIGWKSTADNGSGGLFASTGDNFLKLDPNGNAGYQPASAPGGAVTSFSNSDAGDAQLQNSRNDGNQFRFRSFRFNDGSGSSYPLQDEVASAPFTDPLEDLPFRAFGVNTGGVTPKVESQIYLLNVTALNNSSFNGTPFNPIGQGLPFYMHLAGESGSTGVAIPAATVPEPTSLGLMLAGASLLGLRHRRRKNGASTEPLRSSV